MSFKIYFEKEIKNFWIVKNNIVYVLRNNEIDNLVNYFINYEETSKSNHIEDFFDFEEIEFDENDIILNLEEKENLKSFENALHGESNEDGFLIKDSYIKQVTEYDTQQYIKTLILEKLIEKNQNFDILDKDFIKDVLNTYKNSLELE